MEPDREAEAAPPAGAEDAAASDRSRRTPPDLKVAGVGASAGGLETFRELLAALPESPGLALVLVQHLSPSHESILPEILSNSTNLPVSQVTEGMAIEADHVYVIPPNREMEVVDGHFHLSPRHPGVSHLPIDFLLRSLARSAQGSAIGVILSGTSSDGAIGIRDIKAAGGITIAQDPVSARYDGMPRAAIATGAVDLVLRPTEIARELARIVQHPFTRQVLPRREDDEIARPEGELGGVYDILRQATGVDFASYKTPTIRRRLQRRMVLHKLTKLSDYVKLLAVEPDEVDKLYQDLLIHVTRFFRDPESFQALAEHVYPRILEHASHEAPIRVWVAGCSTGEEAYSVAISLLEFLGDEASRIPVQVFATDVSEPAIEHARAGVYPENIEADVSAERLRRFFRRSDGGYRVAQAVREVCIFARQDVTRDPPFSKLDLILCRNVLIYLGPVLQKRLMGVFHYALKPTGFLVLGEVETVGTAAELFSIAEGHKIYRKKPIDSPARLGLTFRSPEPQPSVSGAKAPEAAANPDLLLQQHASRVLLERYGPPGVVVDDDLRVVHTRGQTGPYLELPTGSATLNVMKLAREGLAYALRTAIQGVRKTRAPVRRRNLQVTVDGKRRTLDLEVVPLVEPDLGPHYLVVFDEQTPQAGAAKAPSPPKARRRGRSEAPDAQRTAERVAELERELDATREHMQAMIQDMEAANEELQAANEEILSSNEELQSTNEELDTAREELQSTNEEINTVNEELHARNEELVRANSDMANLLASVQIAIVIVSGELRIRRFTPMAEKVLNLIATDVGRPIGHIKPDIDCPDLEQRIAEVVESVTPYERQVKDRHGNWYMLRIRPYKNADNRIDGAVLSLFDVDTSVRSTLALDELRGFLDALTQVIREPVVVLDHGLRVVRVSRAFTEAFRLAPTDVEGNAFYDVGNGQWDLPPVRSLLEERLRESDRADGFAFAHDFPGLGRRSMVVNARRVDGGQGARLYILAFQDVHDGAG